MFTEKIKRLRDYCAELDEKTCTELHITQFGNMLCIIMDKGLMDGSAGTEKVQYSVEVAYEALEKILKDNLRERRALRQYNRLYRKALGMVRKTFALEPAGSVMSRYLSIGLVVGAGIGSALMAVINPAMLAAAIGLGMSVGVGIGQSKEREAKDQGRIF